MKKIVCLFVMILFLGIAVTGCTKNTTKNNLKPDAIFDNFNGEVLSLNTRKVDVDKIWSEFQKEDPGYLYDHELLVVYAEGMVSQIFVTFADEKEKRWVVMNGITIGSTIEEVLDSYGESYKQTDLAMGIAYDYKFDKSTTRFIIANDKVLHIVISANL